MAKDWECKYCDNTYSINYDGDIVCGNCRAEWESAKVLVDYDIRESEKLEKLGELIMAEWEERREEDK